MNRGNPIQESWWIMIYTTSIVITIVKFTLVQNYGIMELWFTMENYVDMEKTMVQWKKKLWYNTENYGTKLITMELRFAKEKKTR